MTDRNQKDKKKTVTPVRKPFIIGDAADENTVVSALKFFGSVILVCFVAFIACMTASGGSFLRLLINPAVIAAAAFIFFNNGSGRGADDVARGEILYQRQEKGNSFSEAEKKVCYHPFKGFLIGLIGTLPFLVPAVFLALNTTLQTTGAGTLPSWMQAYTRRSEIGDALISYTQPESMDLTGMIRVIIRICIIPFVNLIGYGSKQNMLMLERTCPVILLLPAVFYGTGYLTGKKIRAGIHTAISENEKRRIRKEKKRIRNRNTNQRNREPEQLN